jgi:uncharacterized protein
MSTTESPLRANPVFWLIWVLLGSAVVAGLTTLAIAMRSADRPLPAVYHWEGEHLDRDFAQARVAATHGIEVTLVANPGDCSATLRNAPSDPEALSLLFASGADAGLDRVLHLPRVAPGQYRGACAPLPAGRWRVSLEDSAGQWALRGQVHGSFHRLELRARNPEGPASGAP